LFAGEKPKTTFTVDEIKTILKSGDNKRLLEILNYLGRNPQKLNDGLRENFIDLISTTDVSILGVLLSILEADSNEKTNEKIKNLLLERLGEEKMSAGDAFEIISLIPSSESSISKQGQFYQTVEYIANHLKKYHHPRGWNSIYRQSSLFMGC
jgi:hypothetical protein